MRLFAPEYYTKFVCIADKCKHSCCRAWDIGVDESTLALARSGKDELLEELKSRTVECDDGYYIERCEDGACPFLDECGLCRLISAKGDEYLPEICREHPRFYNHVGDRVEVGLGLACEAAARIALTSGGYDKMVEVGEVDEEEGSIPFGYEVRERLLDKLASLPDYDMLISDVTNEFNLSAINENWDSLADVIAGLEYLDEAEGDLISSAMDGEFNVTNEYQHRFFAYLLYRYLTVAESESEVRAAIGLAILLSKLFGGIYEMLGGGLESAIEAARIISAEIEYSPDNVNEILFEIDYLLI